MDKKDAWLLELYEGSDPPADAEPGSAEEAVSLREMKGWLEARSAIRSARPDSGAVASVLAAAREASPSGARKDRPARSRTRRAWLSPRRIAVGAVAAALAGFALVGLFRSDLLAPDATDTARLDAPEAAVAETVPAAPDSTGEGEGGAADMRPGETAFPALSPETAPDLNAPSALADAGSAADEALESAAADEQAGGDPPAAIADIPAWDDPDDVMYLRQRIQRIGEGVADGWDAPVAPLEMLPAGSGGDGLVPASERR